MSTFVTDLAAQYQRHRDALHRVAASVLHDVGLQDEAPDVVQDAVRSLMESPPAGPVLNWQAFLVRVTKNKAYDRIRAADVRHHARSLDLTVDDRAAPEEEGIAQVEDEVDSEREGAAVWDSLAMLTQRERLIIRLVDQEKRPQGEVADELAISRARIRFGKQRCRSFGQSSKREEWTDERGHV